MLRLLVPPQVHLPLEAFAAHVAAERLVSRVLPAVRDEVGALAERLPTHLALVWLLACKVHTGTSNTSKVSFAQKQRRRVCRGFFSLQLARVDERVLLHVGLLVEPLAAELAGVGPGVGVDEQVRGQSGRPLEAFAADLAVEASFL